MTVSFFSFNCGSNRDEKRVIFLKRQTDVDGSAQGPRKIYYKVRGRKGRVVITVNCQQQQLSITFHDLCVQREL